MKDTIIGYPLLEYGKSLLRLLTGKPECQEAWKPGRIKDLINIFFGLPASWLSSIIASQLQAYQLN